MKIGLRMILAASVGIAVLQLPARGEDKTPFKDDKEKASYAIGMYFGNQIKRSNLEVDLDTVNAAIKDILSGNPPRLPEQEAQIAIRTYQTASMARLATKNRKEGEEFLEDNKKKEGVKTLEVTTADGKPAELQYKVITEGTGDIPKSNDTVVVNYRGTLINGKEFDSSAKHGSPLKRPANSLIRGWTEALERMKVGSKWELYIPSSLAYGDSAPPGGNIEPGSTLIFEMELLSIENPKPAAAATPATPPQPLTSDIIRVPSADELKKGAKIEIIKAEDAAKQAQAEAGKADKKQ